MIKLAEKLLQSSKVVIFKLKTKKPIFKEPIKIQSFVDKYGNADIYPKELLRRVTPRLRGVKMYEDA